MFNQDFYPTPKNVIEIMVGDRDLKGKVVLEPSAGKGDIVDFCAGSGATVLACEIQPELRAILNQKPCKVIAEDFGDVKKEDVSHIDYIFMNPPFSSDERHILNAFNIAPDGCEINALCNWNTLADYRHNRFRRELMATIETYGSCENLGSVFIDAERQTPVEVGLVRLQKPIKPNRETEFEGFFMEEEEEPQEEAMRPYNFVRDVVNRYVGAVKIFDEQLEAAKRMNALTGYFFNSKIALSMKDDDAEVTREEYKKELQKAAWVWVINKFDLDKYSTSGLREDINKFVEQQAKYPFTMRNIYQMITIIIGTAGNRMDNALEEVFDTVTKHYKENRWGVEGWKTNSHYLLNQKFILGRVAPKSRYSDSYDINYRAADQLNDFVKGLCFMLGENYDEEYATGQTHLGKEIKARKFPHFYSHFLHYRNNWGEWIDWTFFEVKLYKKGSAHIRFKDRDVWARFNQNIARIKGFPLPEKI